MVKVKPGRVKQVVIAVHQLRSREGVSTSNIDLFMKQRYGTQWGTEECAQALQAAVVEGFLECKEDRLYPRPSVLVPGRDGIMDHSKVHRPRRKRLATRRQHRRVTVVKKKSGRGRPPVILKGNRQRRKTSRPRKNLLPNNTEHSPGQQTGDQ